MSDPNFFGPNVKQLLEAPFPSEQIKHDLKRGTDGFEPTYVEAPFIIRRLNDVFGQGGWRHEVIGEPSFFPPAQSGMPPQQVIVRVRLTAGGAGGLPEIYHEQFGACFLKLGRNNTFVDPGSDFKAAVTDGLKKCATYLGIALDLYVKDESPMQGLHRKDANTQGQGSFPAMQTDPNAPALDWQIQGLTKMFQTLGIADGVWQKRLGFDNPSDLKQFHVQRLNAGEHPWVKELRENAGHQPSGLVASQA